MGFPHAFFVTLNVFKGPFHRIVPPMPIERAPGVTILASQPHGTLHIGMTSDTHRLAQHRDGKGNRFTTKYGVNRLVRFEMFDAMDRAIAREKQLKRWHRAWKIDLIQGDDPEWHDLAPGLGFAAVVPRGMGRGLADPPGAPRETCHGS